MEQLDDKYYNTKASVEEYIAAAEGIDGRNLIEKLRRYLPAGSSLLEIGSGPGSDWNLLKEHFNVVGSDNSAEFLNYLNSKYPKGKFVELDACSLDTNERYDGIYSNKVLHHLKDEELLRSIENQGKVLNAKGIICHSFWDGEGSEIFKGLYVNYHSIEELRSLFSRTFEISSFEKYTEFEHDDSILLIAQKK